MSRKKAGANIEPKLKRLRTLRSEPVSPALIIELQKLLADVSNLVAAEAAIIVGETKLIDLLPDLLAAFDRFMIDPEDTDKLCKAKIAVVEALNKLDYDRPEVFLRGIHHVQLEGAWGKPQDTAAPLRGSSAFGLVRINYRDVLPLLIDLLVDEEKVARVSAVQALEATGSVAAAPLLRLKALVGDREAEVISECLTALLRLEPEALPFVSKFLHSGDEAIQEGAALALGETRRPGAFEILRDFSRSLSTGAVQEAVFLAIAMLRLPAGYDFLIERLADQKTAAAALLALAIHRHNDKIRERVAAAVAQTSNAALRERFDRKFRT